MRLELRGVTAVVLGVLLASSFIFVADAASCPSIARTLSRGSSGADVKALQQFLVDDGYLFAEGVTGRFDLDTEDAVKEWQASKKIVSEGTPETTGWGMVGPKTRAAILAACAGEVHIAAWATNGPPRSSSPTTNTASLPAPKTTQCKAVQKPSLPCANAWISVPSGGCIAAWYCIAFNTSKVTSSVPQQNRAPEITGVAGPTSVAVGVPTTWTVQASDPDGGALTYSIDWGDSSSSLSPVDLISALGDITSTRSSFTHSYARSGIFTLYATAKDSAGLAAAARLTINVAATTASTGSNGTIPTSVATTTPISSTSTPSAPVDTTLQCIDNNTLYPYGSTRISGTGLTAATYMCNGGVWTLLSANTQYSSQARYYCSNSSGSGGAFYWSEFPCVNGVNLNGNNSCVRSSDVYTCNYTPLSGQGCSSIAGQGTWLCPFRASYSCFSGGATTTEQWPCAL